MSEPGRVHVGRLSVAEQLYRFIEDEAIPGSGVDRDAFWAGADALIHDFAPRNAELLQIRDRLQEQIDAHHRDNPGTPDAGEYKRFLTRIGYLVAEPDPFTIDTEGVDTEIALQAGPQLVVPMLNARFAANAANARWGSLYDALYGTDAIPEHDGLERGTDFNPARGARVIAWGREVLDDYVPLAASRSHRDAAAYSVHDGSLSITLIDGSTTQLADAAQFVGYAGDPAAPTSVVLVHNGLHLEVHIDRTHPIGATDAAGVKDIVLEAAVTSIMDLEDSVAAVDAEDKTLGYRNWLHLMQGSLSEDVVKNGTRFTRTMNQDRTFSSPSGGVFVLHGRALMLVRHVGHHMYTDAVLDQDGLPVPEGILDAVVTTLGSLHDLRGNTSLKNSRTGSMYIVKPKMHGPDEVTFTVDLFSRVETILGLPPLTLKIGIMDEERRTTVNLAAAIHAARHRIAFINTGFLDRTGDEIHTSMHAGAFVRKAELKTQPYMLAYEDFNVDTGLAAGFEGVAQIGKGMWAMPDLMADMLEQKVNHPNAGASTAWVPSPTAATLHALHYHRVDVPSRQRQLRTRQHVGIDPILRIPLAADANGTDTNWTDADKRAEVDNSIQSILGYVVRWVDQGIGCSKVPDINDVALMEDRATLRISSQHLSNWLMHRVIEESDVLDSMNRMAPVVDAQNANDPAYEKLVGEGGPGIAFEAARELVLEGAAQPNGYTEHILHRARREKKTQQRAH